MAFMVVGIHTDCLGDLSPLAKHLTTNGLFRIAVPIFLIINGFYFFPVLSNKQSVRWLKKILYIYLFWMLIYSYYWAMTSQLSLIAFVRISITGYHHLWYLSGLLGAAAILIFLTRAKEQLLFTFIVLTFLSGLTIQYIGNYHLFEGHVLDSILNKHWVYRNFLLFAFPFFSLGFLINKLNIHNKISFTQTLIITLIGILSLMLETYSNYTKPSVDTGFDILGSLIVVCPAIFILFMKKNIRGKSKNISLYASGVNFIHPLFLMLFNKMTELHNTPMTFLVFLVSLITSYFLIKVNKILKFIL